MKKVYKSRLSLNSILVKAHNKVINVCLEPSIINDFGLWGCTYETDDKELQKAIESHPMFNFGGIEGIWTDDIEEKKESSLDYGTSSLKDAKTLLVQNHGVEPSEVSTKPKLLAMAASLGVQFPNL